MTPTQSPAVTAMQVRLALNSEITAVKDQLNAALKKGYLARAADIISGNEEATVVNPNPGQPVLHPVVPIPDPPLAYITMPRAETVDELQYDAGFGLPRELDLTIGTDPVCPKVVPAATTTGPVPGTASIVGPFEVIEQRVVNGNMVDVYLFGSDPKDGAPAGAQVMWSYRGQIFHLSKRTRPSPWGLMQWYEGVAQ